MATSRTLVKRALKKDELFDFIEGRGNYRVDYSALAINYFPTDFRLIVRTMNAHHAKKEQDALPEKLTAALLKALAEDTLFDLYCAMSIVYYQLMLEFKGRNAFCLDREAVMPELRRQLIEKHEALVKYKDYEGCLEQNGVWGLFIGYNTKLRLSCGVGILSEEELAM